MDLLEAIPTGDASGRAVSVTIGRLRAELPPGALLGGSVVETHDLQNKPRWSKTRLPCRHRT
jgi:hypothetical protein